MTFVHRKFYIERCYFDTIKLVLFALFPIHSFLLLLFQFFNHYSSVDLLCLFCKQLIFTIAKVYLLKKLDFDSLFLPFNLSITEIRICLTVCVNVMNVCVIFFAPHNHSKAENVFNIKFLNYFEFRLLVSLYLIRLP